MTRQYLAYDYDLLEVKPYLNGHDDGGNAAVGTRLRLFSRLFSPYKFEGETIGQLTLPGLTVHYAETPEIVTAVADRLSAHLKDLRLTEQSGKLPALPQKNEPRILRWLTLADLDLQHATNTNRYCNARARRHRPLNQR